MSKIYRTKKLTIIMRASDGFHQAAAALKITLIPKTL
jgi:hypothetical protein